jgi:hypothetical protein
MKNLDCNGLIIFSTLLLVAKIEGVIDILWSEFSLIFLWIGKGITVQQARSQFLSSFPSSCSLKVTKSQ